MYQEAVSQQAAKIEAYENCEAMEKKDGGEMEVRGLLRRDINRSGLDWKE